MSSNEKPLGPRISVGDALGGIARRVGEFVSGVSDTVTLPEVVRAALAEGATLQQQGMCDQAREIYLAALLERPDDPILLDALATCWIEARLFHQQHFDAPTFPAHDPSRYAASQGLVAATQAHESGDFERCLERVRKARRAPKSGTRRIRTVANRCGHILAAYAYATMGRPRRAAHEVLSARATIDEETHLRVHAHVLRLGVHVMLAEGRLEEAEHWTNELERVTQGAPDFEEIVRATRARIASVRGDRAGALALSRLDDAGLDPSAAQVRVALVSGTPAQAQRVALNHLRAAPGEVERQRLWALAHVMGVDGEENPHADDILRALYERAAGLPIAARGPSVDEYAFISLILDRCDAETLTTLLDGPPGSEETVLALLRAREGDPSALSEWVSAGPPARLRRHREFGGHRGPDEVSPLRDGPTRARMLATHRALVLATWTLANDRREEAAELLVRALIEDPRSRRAAAMLGALSTSQTVTTLEQALRAATDALAKIPANIGGLEVGAIDVHLRAVMAARERLVRPLTIAVMGEFSSGKSSLVNALFRAKVAPTGVLPTTSTINIFRRGDTPRARVHRRDGTVSLLDESQISPFLHGLDETSAAQIRFVEIERGGEVIKNASIVDTPGLNALDAYHEEVAREFIDEADAIVWVFSATRGGAASERSMLEELERTGRKVLGVLNKVDTLEQQERVELQTYLQDQLGDVLAALVPLCATEAERWRIDGDHTSAAADPFAPVEDALDAHFLVHARALKRRLTSRTLLAALEQARDSLHEVIEQLERQDHEGAAGSREHNIGAALERFAQRLHDALIAQDEPLTLEWLASGFLERHRGGTSLLDVDASFAADHVEQLFNETIRDTLVMFSREGEVELTLSEHLGARFLPWAAGHMAALRDAGAHAQMLAAAQRRASEGEGAIRSSVRASLEPVAARWSEQLRRMRPELEELTAEHTRRERATGHALATRLRAAHLAEIEALIHFTRPLVEDAESKTPLTPTPHEASPKSADL
ncbi:MAG: dynamin family protein [Nannocystaceae bacterium]